MEKSEIMELLGKAKLYQRQNIDSLYLVWWYLLQIHIEKNQPLFQSNENTEKNNKNKKSKFKKYLEEGDSVVKWGKKEKEKKKKKC